MSESNPNPTTIKVGRRAFTLLFPNLLRPLREEERSALRSAIRKYGVVVPVVVDEHDGVIDGCNRVQLAAEEGLTTIPVDVRRDLTPEMKVELALTLNDARRHLNGRELREARAAVKQRITELKAAGLSIPVIA